MKFYVYGLADPRTPNLIRYLGKTHAPRVRHIQHCTETATTEKGVWIETLRLEGILPQMIILAECPDDESACAKKRELMAMYGSAIADDSKPDTKAVSPLVNSTNQLHRQSIIEALTKSRGKIAPAAKILGISRPTLYEKMKRLGIMTRLEIQSKKSGEPKKRPARQTNEAKDENHGNRDLLYLIDRANLK